VLAIPKFRAQTTTLWPLESPNPRAIPKFPAIRNRPA
jgi:hypothetical protein